MHGHYLLSASLCRESANVTMFGAECSSYLLILISMNPIRTSMVPRKIVSQARFSGPKRQYPAPYALPR